MRAVLVACLSLTGLAACVSPQGDGVAAAPLVGVDGSVDQADRACNVVLRDLDRVDNGSGGYQSNGDSWIWTGSLEISAAAAAEGLTPAVLYQYGSDPTWYEVAATPSPVPASDGFARYTVTLDDHLPGPGMSGTALTRATIQVAPVLHLDAGGRLFDHNRNRGDFDNYVVDWNGSFRIRPAAAVCPAITTPSPARLVFAADYTQAQVGALVPGGQVRVEYDPARLSTCRNSQGGHDLWDVGLHARWQPSGQLVDASVKTGAATLDIPAGARALELWFENTSSDGCHAWDSAYGANYHFDVLAPPAWVGDARVLITRDAGDPCDGGSPAEGGFLFDTWARQRAAISNACFRVWQEGVTDHDDPELWRKLDVRLRWRARGSSDAWREEPVRFDRRVGNDARYAFDLRAIDPFRAYHCPDVPTTSSGDGYVHAELEWYAVVNGVELRPAPGGGFAASFADYASDPYRDSSCP